MATKQEGERLARLEEKVDDLDKKFSAKWVEQVITLSGTYEAA